MTTVLLTNNNSFSSFPSVQRDLATDKADHRLARPVPTEQRWCIPAVRRFTVCVCPRRSADRNVPVQVQAYEADSYV